MTELITDPAAALPEGTPTITSLELDQAIALAAREYIAAQLARPRDPRRIAEAKAALDALRALRDDLTAP